MSTYHRETPSNLNAALESIWSKQTLRPTEIILVEDGVLGEALEDTIVRWEKSDCPLVVLRNMHHSGLAECLNQAIEKAHGEYIVRMDSDDISYEDRFAKQVAYLEAHPKVDILGGSLLEFNDEGTLFYQRNYPATHEAVLDGMYKASPVGHPSVMFRRKVFDYGLRYRNAFSMCEDVSLWFDAVAEGFIINNLQEPILHFRRTPETISRRGRIKAVGEFRAYQEGITKVYGHFSSHKIFSYLRLLFRLMPSWLIRCLYSSKIRNKIA